MRKWHVIVSDSHLAARVAAGGERGEGGGGGGEGGEVLLSQVHQFTVINSCREKHKLPLRQTEIDKRTSGTRVHVYREAGIQADKQTDRHTRR